MKQVYLYIVHHFLDFPESEYGGIWNVVAENDEQCFDFIWERHNPFTEVQNGKEYDTLKKNIVNAHKFLLAEDLECGIVEYMIT
jgi:hypothetical protein